MLWLDHAVSAHFFFQKKSLCSASTIILRGIPYHHTNFCSLQQTPFLMFGNLLSLLPFPLHSGWLPVRHLKTPNFLAKLVSRLWLKWPSECVKSTCWKCAETECIHPIVVWVCGVRVMCEGRGMRGDSFIWSEISFYEGVWRERREGGGGGLG